LKEVFHEIPYHFGADVNISLKVDLDTSGGHAINFDSKRGIVLGDKSNITTTLELLVSTTTYTNLTACIFEFNFEANANVSMEAFVIYPSIKEVSVTNTVLK